MITFTDPAELPEASCFNEEKYVEAVCMNCGKVGDAVCPHCGAMYKEGSVECHESERPITQNEHEERFATLVAIIEGKRNAKFWWACFLIATGHASAAGVSESELASAWGVGKAAVSKVCVEICGILGRPPSRYMKSEKSKESYRSHNVRRKKGGE